MFKKLYLAWLMIFISSVFLKIANTSILDNHWL